MGRTLVRLAVWMLLAGLPSTLLAEGSGDGALFPLSRESLAGTLERDDWDETAPVDIRSDRMSVNFLKREILFWGDVTVTQADFSLTAEEVTAVFGETAEDVRRILARGGVTIRKGDRVARGRELVYDRPEALIVLRGDPYLEQGRNFIRGEEIRAYLNDDRVEVRGGVAAEFRVKTSESDTVPVPGAADAP